MASFIPGRWVAAMMIVFAAIALAIVSLATQLYLGDDAPEATPVTVTLQPDQPPATTPAPFTDTSPTTATTAPQVSQSTPQQFRVALLGDQGINDEARAVLNLIKQEQADLTIVSGDLGYDESNPQAPAQWDAMITDILGAEYPLFASQGNHDLPQWSDYLQLLQNRADRISGASCSGALGVQSACTYQNFFFVLASPTVPATFLSQQLEASNATWELCSWHYNREALQIGGKSDEMNLNAYEACREGGAIIINGHEHNYARTKTLSSIAGQVIDTNWPAAAALRVGGGSTFIAVSGLGGKSIRQQSRCLPSEPPYGCGGEWASIYSSNQNATHGALFIDFNVQGNPNLARGYFKNIDGKVIDSFTIIAEK